MKTNIIHLLAAMIALSVVPPVPAQDGEPSASERAKLEAERERLEAEIERLEAEREALEAAKEAVGANEEAVRNAINIAQNFARMWRSEGGEGEGGGESELYFGVNIESVPRALRKYIDLPPKVGLLFTKVHADSPAQKAGIQDDDILLEFAGQLIVNYEQFATLIDLQKAEQPVPVKLLRKGEEIDLEISLEERVRRGPRWLPVPSAPGAPPAPPAPGGEDDTGQLHTPPGGVEIARAAARAVAQVQPFLPGSVRLSINEEQDVEVDLSSLTESLAQMEQRLEKLQIEEELNWADLVDVYQEAANRRSVVRLAQSQLSLSTEEGRIRMFQEAGEQHAVVTDPQGQVLFSGPVPEDYEETLDPMTVKLIKALRDARKNLDTELSREKNLELREVDESEKLSKL